MAPLATTTIVALLSLPIAGQEGDQGTVLQQPVTVFPEQFSQIRSVVELPGSSVLVADYLEQRVVRMSGSGMLAMVGGEGGGPQEYRLPSGLFPWQGDSVLLYDRGNERFAVISPEAAIVRTFSRHPEEVPYGIHPSGTDRQGRIYFAIPPWARAARPEAPPDSVWTAHWSQTERRVEPLVVIKGLTRPTKPRRGPGFPYVAFASRDGWAVAGDGAVAVVRSQPYHVEWLLPDGRTVSGPEVGYQEIPVTQDDRVAHVRRFLSRNPTSGRGPGGGLGLVPADQLSDTKVNEMVSTNEFASVLPPFDASSVVISHDGNQLWVLRSLSVGTAPRYQVFDRSGAVVNEVTLPPLSELVALGARGVYLAVTDQDGLQQLELHRYPG